MRVCAAHPRQQPSSPLAIPHVSQPARYYDIQLKKFLYSRTTL